MNGLRQSIEALLAISERKVREHTERTEEAIAKSDMAALKVIAAESVHPGNIPIEILSQRATVLRGVVAAYVDQNENELQTYVAQTSRSKDIDKYKPITADVASIIPEFDAFFRDAVSFSKYNNLLGNTPIFDAIAAVFAEIDLFKAASMITLSPPVQFEKIPESIRGKYIRSFIETATAALNREPTDPDDPAVSAIHTRFLASAYRRASELHDLMPSDDSVTAFHEKCKVLLDSKSEEVHRVIFAMSEAGMGKTPVLPDGKPAETGESYAQGPAATAMRAVGMAGTVTEGSAAEQYGKLKRAYDAMNLKYPDYAGLLGSDPAFRLNLIRDNIPQFDISTVEASVEGVESTALFTAQLDMEWVGSYVAEVLSHTAQANLARYTNEVRKIEEEQEAAKSTLVYIRDRSDKMVQQGKTVVARLADLKSRLGAYDAEIARFEHNTGLAFPVGDFGEEMASLGARFDDIKQIEGKLASGELADDARGDFNKTVLGFMDHLGEAARKLQEIEHLLVNVTLAAELLNETAKKVNAAHDLVLESLNSIPIAPGPDAVFNIFRAIAHAAIVKVVTDRYKDLFAKDPRSRDLANTVDKAYAIAKDSIRELSGSSDSLEAFVASSSREQKISSQILKSVLAPGRAPSR